MENATIFEAVTEAEVLRCYPVITELRPHLADPEAFVAQALRQMREGGYNMIYREQDGEVASIAGYRLSENLAWGRFLYVDDLITGAAYRKQGHGRALMEWLIAEAGRQGCGELHLDSGVHRHDAHRLYMNAGLRISSHHFGIALRSAR